MKKKVKDLTTDELIHAVQVGCLKAMRAVENQEMPKAAQREIAQAQVTLIKTALDRLITGAVQVLPGMAVMSP